VGADDQHHVPRDGLICQRRTADHGAGGRRLESNQRERRDETGKASDKDCPF
jgi:hypothetical protein